MILSGYPCPWCGIPVAHHDTWVDLVVMPGGCALNAWNLAGSELGESGA